MDRGGLTKGDEEYYVSQDLESGREARAIVQRIRDLVYNKRRTSLITVESIRRILEPKL